MGQDPDHLRREAEDQLAAEKAERWKRWQTMEAYAQQMVADAERHAAGVVEDLAGRLAAVREQVEEERSHVALLARTLAELAVAVADIEAGLSVPHTPGPAPATGDRVGRAALGRLLPGRPAADDD